MEHQYSQRVAIMAARSTIGQSVASILHQGGAQLAFLGRDLEGVDTEVAAYSAVCDFGDFDTLSRRLGEASEALGGLTGIVQCAGSMPLKAAHQTNRADFDVAVEANLASAFAAVRAAATILGGTGGSVVLISSAAAALGMANHELIGAMKAGIEGLMRSAAATYASRGLRFNAVAPGLVDSTLSAKLLSNSGTRRISESLHPLGRIGAPEDVGRAICWLLDPAQSWVTGQVIGVDGGLGSVQPRPKIGPVKT